VSIRAKTRQLVRQRAGLACEYCGVTETDTGGELTIDHYRPRTAGGSDAAENLLYCCHHCNEYKADYWSDRPDGIPLWNPREQPLADHLLFLADGTLYPITAVGEFTLKRLRLNRTALVAHRLRRRSEAEELRLLNQYRDLLNSLERMHRQLDALLQEHAALMREQRSLLRLLLGRDE
jgi:hypothetical protein